MTFRTPFALCLLFLGALASSGCLHQPDREEFGITTLSFTPSPIVNLTKADLPLYPPLEQLLREWEAAGGTRLDFYTSYSYADGLQTVKELQARVPNAAWGSEDAVPIAYGGSVFMAGPSKIVVN